MATGISNASRECGEKKDGWYIGGGAMSKNGTLLPLVWTLGTMVLGLDPNARWEPNERSLIYIDGEQSFDPPGTEWVDLQVGMLNRVQQQYLGSGQPQLQRLMHSSSDPTCLLKHMGRKYYTPATKAIELVRQGPSERMDDDTVIHLAAYLKHGPLKLFYTSSQVPFFVTPSDRDAFMDYVFAELADQQAIELEALWSYRNSEADTLWEPTWSYADWRWRMIRSPQGLIFPNNGSMHWWVRALSYMHRHQDVQVEGVVEREAVCFGTHITQALRVVAYEAAQQATGHDTIVPEELDDEQFFKDAAQAKRALKNGVEVVVLPPQGVEEW